MKNLIKNLQAANRDLQALSKKVDKIIAQIGKLEKSKPVKKVVAKQAARLTAADTVFSIIKRFKKNGRSKSHRKDIQCSVEERLYDCS